MALSISDIDAWDTGALEEYSRQLARRSRTLAELGDSIADAAKIPDWTGMGADAAQVSFTQLSTDVSDRAATVGALTELASSLIDQVKTLQRVLDDARDHAAAFGLVITDSGAVIDGPGAGLPESAATMLGGPGAMAAAQAAKESARAEVQAQVQALLATAADVEADTVAILTKAAEGGFTGGAMSITDAREKGRLEADDMFAAPPPPSDITAQQAYLDTLSPDQLDEIIREHPEWLANAYGIDPAVRSQAAEAYIPKLRSEILAEKAPLLRELRELQATVPQGPGGPAVLGNKIREVEKKLEPLDNQLADLDQIEQSVIDHGDMHLLGLRPHDNGVGAIVSRGDITEADHVAVHVPGMGTQTEDKPDAGNDLPGEIDKMRYLRLAMEDSLRRDGRADETIATVTYMNMDFPDWFPQASTPDYADTAAPDLAAALNGINATSEKGTNLTVLGHSYGSLTTSEALQNGGTADNVVFYGSPGLESSGDTFDPSSLSVPQDNRYIMLAKEDLIAPAGAVAPFGGPPANIDGLTRLDTNQHDDLPDGTPTDLLGDSRGHSEYDNPKTTSLWNMAAIATGAPDNAIPYDWIKQTFQADPDAPSVRPGVGASLRSYGVGVR